MEELEELKKEAKELGITFSANIGVAKLKKKIDEYYKSQEGTIIQSTDDMSTENVTSPNTGKKLTTGQKLAKAKAYAMKTSIVEVIDNDKRVNSKVNTFTVNCSNEYFDLGTMTLPLNTPIEMMQGHIDVLREVEIPQHTIDPKTGLSKTELRPRYSVIPARIKPAD